MWHLHFKGIITEIITVPNPWRRQVDSSAPLLFCTLSILAKALKAILRRWATYSLDKIDIYNPLHAIKIASNSYRLMVYSLFIVIYDVVVNNTKMLLLKPTLNFKSASPCL